MSGKIVAFGLATLFSVATAHADPASPALRTPGKWRHETRQVGRTTVEVYQREPYSLTGDVDERKKEAPPDNWKLEHRMGPKGAIDVHTR
jgi:hypothetical protein